MWSYAQLHVNGWTEDPESDRRKGVDLTRRALQISPDDPDVLAIAAFVLGYFGEDIDAAIALIDRCLVLNPSFARAWFASGQLRLFAGQPNVALEHFDTSLRLSPRDRQAFYLIGNWQCLILQSPV